MQNAAKQYQRQHESREGAQQQSRRLIADLAEASRGCIDKLLKRVVKHHELHASLLAAMGQRLARKDFDRPEVVRTTRLPPRPPVVVCLGVHLHIFYI